MLKERLKLGIIKSSGAPSLSVIMHTAALQHLNINGEYKAYEVKPEELETVFNKLKKENIKGVNVTIPHKINIISMLDELTDRAKQIGAVNTVLFKENGKTVGDNTDSNGFWNAIPENIRANIKNISILGCGGAAHACIIPFLLNNAAKIKIYGRNKKKLEDFKGFLNKNIKTLHCSVSTSIDLLSHIDLSNTHMLVNTTSVGMYPNTNDSLIEKVDLKKMLKDAFVYDIIYNPLETKLLQYAKSLGLQTLNGVEMLVRQGAESLNIWLEKDVAPIEVMRNAVLDSLEPITSDKGKR